MVGLVGLIPRGAQAGGLNGSLFLDAIIVHKFYRNQFIFMRKQIIEKNIPCFKGCKSELRVVIDGDPNIYLQFVKTLNKF